MRRLLFSMAPMALLACAQAGVLANTGWEDCVNERYGFKFSHPSSLIAGPEPGSGDGRVFATEDNEFKITAWGHLLVMDYDPIDKSWAKELSELGPFATYKRKAAQWYVISGLKDGVEFYRKSFFHKDNGVVLVIEYPHARRQLYDPWVVKIEKSFVPFLAGDFNRLDH
jgi:hypothetical protein